MSKVRASVVPTLYPNEDQFREPISYLSSPEISALGVKYGMVKIVPPSSYKPPLSINKSKFKFVPRIQKLKELNLLNRCRLFFFKQLLNYNKMNGLVLPKDSFEEIEGSRIYYYDLFIAVVTFLKKKKDIKAKELPNMNHFEMERNYDLWNFVARKLNTHVSFLLKIYHWKLKSYFDFLSTKSEFSHTLIKEKYPTSLLYETSSESENESENENDDEKDESCLICRKNDNPEDTLLCDSCNKPFHKYCLSPPLSKIPKDSWFCDNCVIGNGHYGFKDSSLEYSLEDFHNLSNDFDKNFFGKGIKPNVERLEDIFWDLVDNTDNNDIKVHYGADIHHQRKGEVSGFPTQDYVPKHGISKDEYKEYVSHPMNLNNLPYDPKSLLNFLNVDISGMTIPWIYIGNTFSTFCWHVEDQYTLSANYQHFGATKKWYSIPSSNADQFERYMQNLAPDLFAKQPDILHQLVTLVSPFKLIENNIECYTANQEPGEYIITYPRVYHAGFNAGYNFNEAVNFTMTDWLDYGIISTQNYKQNVGKASVFDVWLMIINIVKHFNQSDDSKDVDLKLVKVSIEKLKSKLNEEYQLRDTIEDLITTKPIYQPKKRSEMYFDIRTQQEKDWEDDGIPCSKCNGFCTFFYVRHFKPRGSPLKSSHLITPLSTPEESEESKKRRSKRLKIKQTTEEFDVEILCLDDYLKLHDRNSIDEFYVLRDINEVKNLVQEAERKLVLK